MENKFWVLEYGRDCDGCETRGRVYGFSNHEEAEKCLESCVEWSDGMQYQLTESVDDLKEYCHHHQLKIAEYLDWDRFCMEDGVPVDGLKPEQINAVSQALTDFIEENTEQS